MCFDFKDGLIWVIECYGFGDNVEKKKFFLFGMG